jgi:hypothetical protein
MTVFVQVPKGVRQIAKDRLDPDRISRIAQVKIRIVKWQVPLRMKEAAYRFKDCRFGRISAPDQAYNGLISYRPVQLADTTKVSYRKIAYPHVVLTDLAPVYFM